MGQPQAPLDSESKLHIYPLGGATRGADRSRLTDSIDKEIAQPRELSQSARQQHLNPDLIKRSPLYALLIGSFVPSILANRWTHRSNLVLQSKKIFPAIYRPIRGDLSQITLNPFAFLNTKDNILSTY